MKKAVSFLDLRDHLIAEINDLLESEIDELQSYFDYLSRTKCPKLTEQQIDIILEKVSFLKNDFECALANNNEFSFDQHFFSEEMKSLIWPDGVHDSNDLRSVWENTVSYIEAIAETMILNLNVRDAELDVYSFYESVKTYGMIFSKISNRDLERLGYKKNFQISVKKKHENKESFYKAVRLFLNGKNFDYSTSDRKPDLKAMYYLLQNNRESLAEILTNFCGVTYNVDLTEENGKKYLSFIRNNSPYYKIESADEYGSKYTEKLKPFLD